ncbi:MAG TPA: extracellular solute-binding protein, partial [Candidatus Paceibacterota bacterium]|nr:extracellular solute-binding protein [Candidatus Paceibacterota bacterium]
ALANGAPPDLILFTSEEFSQFKDKLYPIPYTVITERTYRDTNIDGAQIFLSKNGILGIPLVVDPLVVYYNKDILAKSNFVVPPPTWSDLQKTIPLLTQTDSKNNLIQSTIALGTANNVDHLRDILSALFLQTGNAIVSSDASSGTPSVVLAASPTGSTTTPTAQALQFYTSFANPTSSNYSWNTALPDALQQFLAGKSAFYIGRASELFTIQAQNPNLNFDVAQLFQTGASNTRPLTFGSFYGVGILKNAPNFTAAYAAVTALGATASVDALSKALSLPPVQRSLLLVPPTSPYVSVFFNAALSAFAWPDPNEAQTTATFQTMITDVTSGKSDPVTAIYTASKNLQSSLAQ